MSLISCTQIITIICNKIGRIPFEKWYICHTIHETTNSCFMLQIAVLLALGLTTPAKYRLINTRSDVKYLHLKISRSMLLLHGCSTMCFVGHDTAAEEKCSIYNFTIMTKLLSSTIVRL